jgi:hypothetical protein
MKQISIVVGIVALASLALAEPDKWDWYNEDLKKAVDGMATETYCAGPVKASYDVASFKSDDAMKVATQCGVAVGGIGSYCYEKTPKAKAAVLKSVQSVTCHFDATLKKDTHHATKASKKGSHIDFSVGLDASNVGDEMQDFLRKSL